MTWRTSLPRPAAPLALMMGFLWAASAWAQSSADSNSVYDRRRASEAPLRRPQGDPQLSRQLYPSSPRGPRQPVLYPQPARGNSQPSAVQGLGRQPSTARTNPAGPSQPPRRDRKESAVSPQERTASVPCRAARRGRWCHPNPGLFRGTSVRRVVRRTTRRRSSK